MESVTFERVLSLWLFVRVHFVCMCHEPTKQSSGGQTFCLESQSQEEIKEQLNSTTALGPKPNGSFQEALKLLTGPACLPSLSEYLLFSLPSSCNLAFIHPSRRRGCRQRGRKRAQWAKRERGRWWILWDELVGNQSNKTLQRWWGGKRGETGPGCKIK